MNQRIVWCCVAALALAGCKKDETPGDRPQDSDPRVQAAKDVIAAYCGYVMRCGDVMGKAFVSEAACNSIMNELLLCDSAGSEGDLPTPSMAAGCVSFLNGAACVEDPDTQLD